VGEGGGRAESNISFPRAKIADIQGLSPGGGRWAIDWTHERVWRWCTTNAASLAKFEAEIAKMGIVSEVKFIPGLDLYTGMLQGIGAIVNTKEEARKVLHDVLSLVDRNMVKPDTSEYVLVAEDIQAPEKIRDPDKVPSAPTGLP
jgi:hypothetical protein